MAVVALHTSSDSSFEEPIKDSSNWSSSPSLSQDSSSTESESDDYIAELTRQMAHYMLQDFDDPSHNMPHPIQEEAGDDMKQREKSTLDQNQIHHVSEFLKKQALIDEQIRSVQLNRLKQERERKQSNNGNRKGRGNRGKSRALVNGMPPVNNTDNNNKGQKPSWWSQQQSIRNGGGGCPEVMRAVFLGDSGKASTTGTGVFLPRVAGNSTTTTTAASAESRKKPGYSTVLIPARVVQALKLHFDKISNPATAAAVTVPLQHDAVTGDVKYAFQLQGQKGESPSKPAVNQRHLNLRHHNHQYQDMGLPQEWTY